MMLLNEKCTNNYLRPEMLKFHQPKVAYSSSKLVGVTFGEVFRWSRIL